MGGQGLLLLMELEIFDNDDQAAKHYCRLHLLEVIVAGNSNVLWPSHYYEKNLNP